MPKVREYSADDITVSYDVARCIHAAECIRGAPSVFDPEKRPWIQPANGSADKIARVIATCPSGALHFTRHDGGDEETVPSENSVTPQKNGPLYVRGNVIVQDHEGNVLAQGPRFALCRCGQSRSKPFCDLSHDNISFEAPDTLGDNGIKETDAPDEREPLYITASQDGPFLINGYVHISSNDGSDLRSGMKCALCRCGSSGNKPFCDGSHRTVNFKSL